MKKLSVFLLALALTTNAFAATITNKQIDTIENSTGGAVIAVPAVGSSFDTDSNTLTLSNKSISGSTNTFSNIPVSALASGTAIGVPTGGTGFMTATSNGILYGNGTSALQVTAAGSQYQSLQAGSGGVPAFGAVALNQSAAVTGTLPSGNGGLGVANPTAGGVLVGAGSSAVTAVTCSNSGYVLAWGGSSWSCVPQSAGGGSPNVVSSYASPASITAGGGVTITGIISNGPNFAFVSGSGGTVTVTATPSVTGCSSGATPGSVVTIVGGTNAITLQDSTNLASSGLTLNGNWTSAPGASLTLLCASATGPYLELSRTN